MARRIAVILLAVLVALANSLCACADSSTSMVARKSKAAVQNSHCHSAAPQADAKACRSGTGSQERQDHGSCGHCTGTVAADVSSAKITVPSPVPAPLLFVVALPDLPDFDGQLARLRFEHTGLSPPVPSPTLLSLFCSLLN